MRLTMDLSGLHIIADQRSEGTCNKASCDNPPTHEGYVYSVAHPERVIVLFYCGECMEDAQEEYEHYEDMGTRFFFIDPVHEPEDEWDG